MSDRSETPDTSASAPELRPLDRKAVTLWRLTGLGRAAFFTAATGAAEILMSLPTPAGLLTGAVAVVGLVAAVVVPGLRYRAWGFALRDRDVYLRYGILFRTTSIVPHARIQHVDTRHGPVDRWLGLASVVIFTAGSRGAIIPIPALAEEEADEIRDRLVALSGAGDAV